MANPPSKPHDEVVQTLSQQARNVLHVTTPDGTTEALSAKQLERYFAQLEYTTQQRVAQQVAAKGRVITPKNDLLLPGDANYSELYASISARFGLDSPVKMLNFLNSPGGKALKMVFNREAAILAGIKKQQMLLTLQQERALLFIAGMKAQIKEDKEDSKKQQHENEAQAIKMLKAEQKLHAPHYPRTEGQTYLQTSLDMYGRALTAIEDDIIARNEALREAEDELLALEDEMSICLLQYDAYNEDIIQMFQDWDDRHDDVSYETVLSERLHGLEEAESSPIDTDTAARRRLWQVMMIRSVLSFMQGHVNLYTHDGEQTNHLHLAHFYVPQTKRIEKRNGELYLLLANQDFEQLNDREKHQARQDYDSAKPDLLGPSARIQEERDSVLQQRAERIHKLRTACQTMREELLFFGQQYDTVKLMTLNTRMQLQQMRMNALDKQPELTEAAQETPVALEKAMTVERILHALKRSELQYNIASEHLSPEEEDAQFRVSQGMSDAERPRSETTDLSRGREVSYSQEFQKAQTGSLIDHRLRIRPTVPYTNRSEAEEEDREQERKAPTPFDRGLTPGKK